MANLFLPDVRLKQVFHRHGDKLRRTVSMGGNSYVSTLDITRGAPKDPGVSWRVSYLRGNVPSYPAPAKTLTTVDLFCGAGGLTYGIGEAASLLGIEIRPRLAIDLDDAALEIYQHNIGVDAPLVRDISKLLDYKIRGSGPDATFSYPPTFLEPLIAELSHDVDLLVAGPPCQGHSNLNNRTRRADERNLLYVATAAFAIAARARAVVIENVPEVLNDKHRVVATARALLFKAGYSLSESVLSADRFGVPQTRRRHFLVAIRNKDVEFHLTELVDQLEIPRMNVGHVLKDLVGKHGRSYFDSAATLSEENKKRIDWLFSKGEYDLPDHARPVCHQKGTTYNAVYGRLRWDAPSGTITTGFLSPGRGRYIHPVERRGLTPHEAARIQGFPDTFRFVGESGIRSKKTFAKVIGDAVPPCLGAAVGLATLSLVPYAR